VIPLESEFCAPKPLRIHRDRLTKGCGESYEENRNKVSEKVDRKIKRMESGKVCKKICTWKFRKAWLDENIFKGLAQSENNNKVFL